MSLQLKRTLFIVNPRAGRGRGLRIWQKLRRRNFTAEMPTSATQTALIARQGVAAGVERIIVFGGDGTISLVANELAYSRTALGVVAAGTGNDFARNCGLPGRPDLALEAALHGPLRRIDLGRGPGGRAFINAAGFGFDAEVAAVAGGLPEAFGGTLPYVLGALGTLAWFRPVPLTVQVDGQTWAGPALLASVANGPFLAGGMQLAPSARVADGQLDVCIVGAVSRLELIYLLTQVYKGRHVGHPKVHFLRGRRVWLQGPPGLRVQLDGETFLPGPLGFAVQPGALRLASPF